VIPGRARAPHWSGDSGFAEFAISKAELLRSGLMVSAIVSITFDKLGSHKGTFMITIDQIAAWTALVSALVFLVVLTVAY
jgi:hypothetical protein